jgi:hypothetical protein
MLFGDKACSRGGIHSLGFNDFGRVKRDPDFKNVVLQTEFATLAR